MRIKKKGLAIFCSLFFILVFLLAQTIDLKKIKKIRLKTYPADGLTWKGESAQNTNWNKITETPDGRIWYCGGDHWGTDAITGPWQKGENYERPWGFGNT